MLMFLFSIVLLYLAFGFVLTYCGHLDDGYPPGQEEPSDTQKILTWPYLLIQLRK